MIRRVTFAALACAAAALGSGAAEAHGPSRLKLVMEQKLDATPDEVWAVIGDFHDMSWHPAVASQTGEGGYEPEVGKRVLHLKADAGDPTISETLTKINPEKRTYSYMITEVDPAVLPVTNYASTLTVKDDGGMATVEWKGGFYRGYPNNDPPAELNDDAANAAVTAIYQAGFDALVERFGARE